MTSKPIRSTACKKAAVAFACAIAAMPVTASAQELRISSPANGSIVAAGQTVKISVAVPANIGPLTSVAVVGQRPIGSSRAVSAPPFEFVIQIPPDTEPGSYTLCAVAGTPAGRLVSSEPISIEVQTKGEPLSINIQPSTLAMAVGELAGLRVVAKYSDGSIADVSRSRSTSYISSDPAVAVVTRDGLVKAVGTGTAVITISERAAVRVTVHERNKH